MQLAEVQVMVVKGQTEVMVLFDQLEEQDGVMAEQVGKVVVVVVQE